MATDPLDSPVSSKSSKSRYFIGVFAGFFLIGCAGLVPVAWQAKRDYRVAKAYLDSTAEIIEAVPINSGVDTRPGKRRNPSTRPSFVFRFATKEGQIVTTRGYDAYGGREAPPEEWRLLSPGDKAPCWYDPADPEKAVLSLRFNPHFYWLLALPVVFMGFSGLLLRECFRRAVPPVLKGVEKGRRLEWRLPPVASQRAMTGCFGVAIVILALLTVGFTLAALDYKVQAYQYRWIRTTFGFNMNGWWTVAFASLLVTLLFLWAFLHNLRWIAVPEPVVEVDATRYLPGQTGRLHLTQTGPLEALAYSVSLICEINGTPGKPPAVKKTVFERPNVRIDDRRDGGMVEFEAEFKVPQDALRTCKSVPLNSSGRGNLVGWFIRVERRVSAKDTLQTDFEILVGTEPA